jgi:hypothetical protein
MSVLPALILLLALQTDPLAESLKRIDEAVLKAHLAVLASDEFEGRAAGFPGNEKAVEYLVKELTAYGVEPAGVDGYLQEFEFGSRGETRKAKNVIGVIPGTDPRLREEFVAIGGHLDHVGRKGQQVGGQADGPKDGDEIWNGADDNASGTAAVLAVARAFTVGGLRPRRSVLICFWNAEEAGLWGSRRWAASPTRPLSKVVYYLNLDMVGRNPERPMDVEGVKNAEGDDLERILTAACEAERLRITKYDHTNEAMFRSDGVSLLQEGIPATMFFTYWHADYHRVGDHPDKIAYENLAKIARVAFRTVLEVGNLDRPLRINPDTPLKGRRLGIRGDDVTTAEGKGAVKVASVEGGSSLEIAGLQTNDLILGVAGQPLAPERPMADFWKRMQFGPADQEIDVQRGADLKRLKVEWTPRKR